MWPAFAGSGFALVRFRRRIALSVRRRTPRGRSARLFAFDDRRGEIRARCLGELLAELVAQNARRHLGDVALGKIAELKWPERHPDQPRDLQPEMTQHVAHLAVLAFTNGKRDPHVGGLLAIELRVDRPVADA